MVPKHCALTWVWFELDDGSGVGALGPGQHYGFAFDRDSIIAFVEHAQA